MNDHQLEWLTCPTGGAQALSRDLPYVSTPASQLGRRVLVLAPHPDDEVFGLGGTLNLLRQAGAKTRVVVVTKGAGRAAPDRADETAAIRQAESREASLVLGGYELCFEDFSDGLLDSRDPRLYAVLDRHVNDFQPDVVFCTGVSEVHPDHFNLGRACLRLLALHWAESLAGARLPGTFTSSAASLGNTGLPWDLAFYEIGPWLQPTDLVDITQVIAVKHQAMLQFKSELAYQDYPRHIRALNQLRSYSLPKTVLAAESFCRISKLIEPSAVNSMIEAKTPGISQAQVSDCADSLHDMLADRLRQFRG